MSKLRVRTIMLTHTHVDHFGGIEGVFEKGYTERIIAPEHFMEEATLENAFVGDAMSRRASYQYGTFIPKNANAHVDNGLGKVCARGGTISIMEPTHTQATFCRYCATKKPPFRVGDAAFRDACRAARARMLSSETP